MTDYEIAAQDSELRTLLQVAVDSVNAEEGSVLLLTEDGTHLEFVLSESPVASKLRGIRQPLNKGITGLAFTLQQPMVVNDVSRDGAFDPTVQQQTQVCTRSIMVVPLVAPLGELGALTAINARQPGGFDTEALTTYNHAAQRITERLLALNLVLPNLE